MSNPQIDAILHDAISSGKFLGLSVVAVDRDGNTLYSKAYGKRSFQSDEPMTISTGGWLASMSKLQTSVAILHAVHEGLVGLDDDVAKILPELQEVKVLTFYDKERKAAAFEPIRETVTLRRLLSHSAGLSYPNFSDSLQAWATDNGRQMDALVGDFDKDWNRPMTYQPGQGWCYGTGIDWAGKVLEKVTGKSLGEYLQLHVWDPLGMSNTTFHPEGRDNFELLDMGQRVDGPGSSMGPSVYPHSHFYPVPAVNEAGGAGIFSTAEDYAKLLSALLRSDGKILKEQIIEELVRPQLNEVGKLQLAAMRKIWVLPEIPQEVTVDHGLGGLITTSQVPGGRPAGAMAWDGMSSPHWILDRVTGVAMVMMTQILGPDPDSKELFSRLERALYLPSN